MSIQLKALDDHLIYAFVLVGLSVTDSGRYLGFGNRWGKLLLVAKNRFLA